MRRRSSRLRCAATLLASPSPVPNWHFSSVPAATELGGRRSRARARLACWRAAHEPPDLVRAVPPSPSCRIRREGRRDAERRAAAPLCSRILVIAQLMLRPPHLSLSFSSDLRAAPSRSSRAIVEGHRLARPRRRRDSPRVAVIWARRGLPRALQPLAGSGRRGVLWSWLPPAKAGAEEVVLQPIREISGTVKLLSSKSISYRGEETLPLSVCLQVECMGDDGEEQDGLQMMKDLNLVFHDASNLFDLMLEW